MQSSSPESTPTEAFHIPELVSIMKNMYLATRQLTFSRTIR